MLSKKESIVKNIFGVAVSNVISIVGGIIVGLLLPKVLPVEDYGWYKTFTLYTAYLGFVGAWYPRWNSSEIWWKGL